MLKHRNLVLGLVLGFEGQVLGLELGPGTQVLVNNTA